MLALVLLLTLCSIALLTLTGVRTCLIVVTVQGQSMLPALREGDRVLALRHFRCSWIRTGRIVLVNPAGEGRKREREEQAVPMLQIKRVVALEGESAASLAGEASQIPPRHLFVCGDNRQHSIDSRIWGPLPLQSVTGLLLLKLPRPHSPGAFAVLPLPGLPTGQLAPPFTACMFDGQTVSLEHYRGQSVLLLFLTVSELVRQRLPTYLALATGAAARETRFVLVWDCSMERTRAFLQQWQVSLPVAIAPMASNSFFSDYRISSVPAYCLLSPEGCVQQTGRADDTLADWCRLKDLWSLQSGAAGSART